MCGVHKPSDGPSEAKEGGRKTGYTRVNVTLNLAAGAVPFKTATLSSCGLIAPAACRGTIRPYCDHAVRCGPSTGSISATNSANLRKAVSPSSCWRSSCGRGLSCGDHDTTVPPQRFT